MWLSRCGPQTCVYAGKQVTATQQEQSSLGMHSSSCIPQNRLGSLSSPRPWIKVAMSPDTSGKILLLPSPCLRIWRISLRQCILSWPWYAIRKAKASLHASLQ